MPAGCGDDRCREIMRNGIYRISNFQFEIRKQNIGGSIERGIGGIEPRTAWVIRFLRYIPVIVIAGFGADGGWMSVRQRLATGPEGKHQ